jgi:hypothetical protein
MDVPWIVAPISKGTRRPMRLFVISSMLDSELSHDLLNEEANIKHSRHNLDNSVDSLRDRQVLKFLVSTRHTVVNRLEDPPFTPMSSNTRGA